MKGLCPECETFHKASEECPMSQCQTCGKKFRDTDALRSHAKSKGHQQPEREPERESSMADLMIDAQIDRAMGLPVEDWLTDMLPD